MRYSESSVDTQVKGRDETGATFRLFVATSTVARRETLTSGIFALQSPLWERQLQVTTIMHECL